MSGPEEEDNDVRAPSAKKAIIAQLFSTPVARIACPYAAEFNGPLVELVLARLDPLQKRLGYKSETPDDLAHWGDPVVDSLSQWVLRAARQFTETITRRSLADAFADSAARMSGGAVNGGAGTGGEGSVAVVVSRSWASVYRKGDRHEAHFHPNTALTAIYYAEAPGKCELDLLDPRPNVDYFDPGISLAGSGHRVRLSCSPGELVLFPGWLKHAVPEFNDGSVRISISWNLNYASES
ncbi:2OG-Fe(II) oxygenase family protein [Streptomyces sp. NBC_00988]|uniref:putative 2OG-Fe(II) oxygenase n=1 Tax=Streptomyces sp. NBC_00988 TaxID=2903704 RepID=UPI0038657C10|nr:2OG-Fe(II) oxygenase family protein [Streptomyces sp. NBC_00988]